MSTDRSFLKQHSSDNITQKCLRHWKLSFHVFAYDLSTS